MRLPHHAIVLVAAAAALAAGGCGGDEEGTAENQPPAQGTGTAEGNVVTQPAGTGTTQGAERSRGADVRVTMRDISYIPARVTASRGQTIVWTNEDDVTHTVTQTLEAAGGPDSPEIPPGGRFAFTPAQKGDISYYCRIHPTQEGTIVVK